MTDPIPSETIASRIYFIRGKKIMLDRDLAELYGVRTKVLKQAVRRNIDRFPDDFMFEMGLEEFENWRSPFVTSKSDKMGLRYSPMAFTEFGIAMLSSVLKSQMAIQVNIQIMRTSTRLREMLAGHDDLRRKIEEMGSRYDAQFRVVFEAIRSLLESEEPQRKKTGFTAKEAQARYGGETMGKFTPQAKRRWEATPADMRLRIMNDVWCVNCRATVGIGGASGRIKKGN